MIDTVINNCENRKSEGEVTPVTPRKEIEMDVNVTVVTPSNPLHGSEMDIELTPVNEPSTPLQ